MSGHKKVERNCDNCGKPYMALVYRLKKGQSLYCSLRCFNEWQKKNSTSERLGKENANVYFDKAQSRYYVQWIDDKTNKPTTTTWSNWAWEMNFGEIPEGYRVGFKDGNSMNAVLDNLYLQSWYDWADIVASQNRGRMPTETAKKNMSNARKGMKLSESHRKNISFANIKRWESGVYDTVHKGKYNKWYKDGKGKEYPPEFYEIKDFIKDRDNYTCQICGKSVYRSRHAHVHHIDGDKQNNAQNNLILFCSKCHSKVHHPNKKTPKTILVFSSQLNTNL